MLQPRVPRSVVRTDRTEHTALRLDVVEGALPSDLSGHLYVVAPAHTVEPVPIGMRTTLMVGDGMICRFDLSPAKIELTSRLARTHDFVADRITEADPALEAYRFGNHGLVRIGRLGTRDFANTAFVPMKKGADPTRLVLTFDAGRPVEIDPVTLEVLTPVGARDEWRPEALPDAVFPIVLSPAHPAWDRATDTFFTLNYGRGLGNMAATIPIVYLLSLLPDGFERVLDDIASVLGFEAAYRWLEKRIERVTTELDRCVERFTDRELPWIPDTFTDLIRWDGDGALERWRLVLPDGDEVAIQQSVHQIAVTRDHVVVLETGFKIGLQSAFNDPLPHGDVVDRLLRAVLTRPQIAETIFYVVPRAALDDPSLPVGDDGVRRVTCRKVAIPVEADHFLADYDDAGGRVTVHVAHAPATDLAEWVRPYDVSAYDGAPIAADLHGMLAVGAMDVGRFGRYVIDASTGAVVDSKTLTDDRLAWAIALYAGRALNTEDALPERIDQLYWCTEGCFPELLTDFVYHLYERYPHRLAPLSEIREMGQTGRPSAVVRVDTASMTFADAFALPTGIMAGSLQLVPSGGGGPTDGYLVGTMYTDARTELWIFDASDLAAGPLCKLASPDWRIGFSLHTAWLPQIQPRTAAYAHAARDELEDAVAALPDDAARARLAQRLEDELY